MREVSLQELEKSAPAGELFADKQWLSSPRPLALEKSEVKKLQRLGNLLASWQAAQESLYLRSSLGKLPEWIAAPLDAGKPEWLVQSQRTKALRGSLPEVIRPDLLLQEQGFALTELDSVPGGIGLTHWLNSTYAQFGWDVVGGAKGMLTGFAGLFSQQKGSILVSKESQSYRPEMEWLSSLLREEGVDVATVDAEGAEVKEGETAYRFFELFDLENITGSRELVERAARGEITLTNAARPLFEEKLWAALLWLAPLRHHWELATRRAKLERLKQLVPQAWLMDPTPLPYLACHPGIEVHDLLDVGNFSQKQRRLILKVSGFSELAWGSRGVVVGEDVPQEQWQQQVSLALQDWSMQPQILQRFAPTRLVEHPYWDPDTGEQKLMKGRVRLCPYYFRSAQQEIRLGGILATIVPADKKIIHGMKDGILCPVVAR